MPYTTDERYTVATPAATSGRVDIAPKEGNPPEPGGQDARPPGRYFTTGAYRDDDAGKPDYEGFLSPLVIQAYGAYMHRHRRQSDGRLRDSDNWQAGIPRSEYLKSALRHLLDLWLEHRGHPSRDGIDEALGGLLFNIMGYWHEHLKAGDE